MTSSTSKHKDPSLDDRSLIIIEFLLFSAAIQACYHLNGILGLIEQPILPSNTLAVYTLLFALTTQLSVLGLGLYNSRLREEFSTVFRRLALANGIAYFIFSLAILVVPEHLRLEISLLACSSTAGLLATTLLRLISQQQNLLGIGKRRLLVVGAGERASIIERRMRRAVDRQSFQLLGFIKMPGDADGVIKRDPLIELDGESLTSYARRNRVDEIIVACDERRGNLPTEELFACKIRGINIIEILDFIERETGQVAVNLIYPSWVIYSNGFSSTNYLRNSLDWLLNTTLAFFVFILALPLMIAAIVAIKIEEGLRAPVFYLQERLGLDGEPFNIVKFRSMSVDAEKDGAKWATKNDSRVTKVGAFLRKYRVDELPQLYNVFRGDMGFVGPRPERPEFIRDLARSIPYYKQRLNVKPGLTGWAQLQYPYGASVEDARQKLHFDLYYIKHRSFLLDLHILIRTAEIVLFGKGR